MRRIVAVLVCLVAGLSSQPVRGQFIRVPIIRPPIVRPPVVPHIPVHVPVSSGHRPGANDDSLAGAVPWLLGGVGIAGVGGGAWYVLRKWKSKTTPRAIVRIVFMPPGEAPAAVRAAWVGLEFPLILAQLRPEDGPAQQVLSRCAIVVPDGYAVDGKAAIEILESASAEAAAWWRENAPDVLTPGCQIVFPAYVCERLDDLAPQPAESRA